MKSLEDTYRTWLINYQQSPDFACKDFESGCGIYHVLSPILHDFGFIPSYKTYEELILRTCSKVLFSVPCPEILIVGVDSESSAKEIQNCFEHLNITYRLVFIDCCQTPLNRINKSIEPTGLEYIKTHCLDIFASESQVLNNRFDIVFADSFLMQFSAKNKIKAIKKVSSFLKSGESIAIFREYFGDIKVLLSRTWENLFQMLDSYQNNIFETIEEKNNFKSMIFALNKYYEENGTTYFDPTEFKKDLELCGLRVISEFENKRTIDRIFAASK